MTHPRTFLRPNALRFPAAAVLAAAGLVAGCAEAGAQEAPPVKAAPAESARAKVERLLPDLMSEQDAVRERAEREIVALGDAGRAELDRLTRDADPQKAIAALKLLQSDAWDRAAREQKAQREAPGGRPRVRGPLVPPADVEEWRKGLEQQFEEMRRRMQEWERDLDPGSWVPRFGELERGGAGGRSSGTIVEDGRSLSWSIDESGKVKVTTRDGADAKETTVEAPSLDALRKDHPEVAKRLEGVLPRRGARRFVFEWPPRAWQPAPGEAEDATKDTGPLLRDGEQSLERSDAPADVPGPVLGIGWDAVPDVLRDQLDLPAGGMVVASVVPGSLAEKLGLRRNDVLLRVGERPVSSPQDVRKALEAIPAEQKVTVEIVRKGRREVRESAR